MSKTATGLGPERDRHLPRRLTADQVRLGHDSNEGAVPPVAAVGPYSGYPRTQSALETRHTDCLRCVSQTKVEMEVLAETLCVVTVRFLPYWASRR